MHSATPAVVSTTDHTPVQVVTVGRASRVQVIQFTGGSCSRLGSSGLLHDSVQLGHVYEFVLPVPAIAGPPKSVTTC